MTDTTGFGDSLCPYMELIENAVGINLDNLELRTRSGKKHTLSSRITGQRLARRLIKDLESVVTA